MGPPSDAMRLSRSRRHTAAALMMLFAAGCNPFSDAAAMRPMTLEPAGSGSVFVQRGGEEIEVTGRFSLADGDLVRTASPGARLALESDRFASVGQASTVRVMGGGSLEVVEGSVLAEAGRHMTVALDDVTASTSDGIMRVDRYSASSGVASYSGIVAIAAPGQERVLLEPRCDVSVAAGQVVDPRPYGVDVDDDWDRLHLADVVELDEQLQRYDGAIAGRWKRVDLGAPYFRALGDSRGAKAMARYLDSPAYSTSDLLIAYSIADSDTARQRDESLTTAFGLRRDGGQWGVVATIMDVRPDPLIAGLEDLIFAAGAVAEAPDGAVSLSGGPARDTRDSSAPAGGSGGDTSAGGGGGDKGSDSGDGSGDPSGDEGSSGVDGDEASDADPPPEEDCANLIDCVLDVLPLGGELLP